jgi:ankyrin repeat protein
MAIFNKDEVGARLLIEAGADIEKKGPPLGNTALHLAAQYNLIETVRLLLAKGAKLEARNDVSETPLILAAYLAGLDTVKFLVDQGADIGAKTRTGDTALVYAAATEHAENVVTFLIKHGAEVNVRNAAAETPLKKAIFYDRQATIEILRAHGGAE